MTIVGMVTDDPSSSGVAPRSRFALDSKEWPRWAKAELLREEGRTGETNLLAIPTPSGCPTIYMKDETALPTGSLKHRLARSLFSYALYNGWIGEDTRIVECSSGSTAVSEAYFSRLIGVEFTAVVPRNTSSEKLAEIELHGGTCLLVDSEAEARETCVALAKAPDGKTHFMDQFTYAERAVDWRAESGLTASAFRQLQREEHPVPSWIVCGAGTGGTATSFGRYLRAAAHPTRLCLADPEGSIYHRVILGTVQHNVAVPGSLIEGVGRRQQEPSFLPTLIDRATAVCDADSVGAAHALSQYLGRKVGGSSGTNLWVAIQLAEEMRQRGEKGSILTLLCDKGERYASTIYNAAWLAQKGIDHRPAERVVADFLRLGRAS